MITDRDFCILKRICDYYVLNRPQIQHLCFSGDTTGRVTRRRLQALVKAGLVNRMRAQVLYPGATPAGSVYYPSSKGAELVAEQTGDDAYLLTPTQTPQPHHVLHWLAISQTHITLDEAIASQDFAAVDGWVNEWDVVNKGEADPSKRFRLYALLSKDPKLVCAPDAAFLLTAAGLTKVFYVEQDRGTSGVRQVAASKCKGYAGMAEANFHRHQFPDSNVNAFSVLCIAPTPRRRDALRKAFGDKVGAELWKFASVTELTSETFLFTPIWYPCTGEPTPLVKRPGEATGEGP